ncbi:MAG: glycosyl hydrolase family 43 [bacterium]
MKRSDIKNLRWQLHEKNPLIHPPGLSPVIADPSVIVPEDSPDGRWHLFAHAIFGIYHYVSSDGVQWSAPKRLFGHAMRPFIYHENGTYYLLYERYKKFHILFAMLPIRWQSRIEMRTSKDLINFSDPSTIFEPFLDWHCSGAYGNSVSNPYLVKIADRYVLYYSSSLVHVDDCGFNEPKHIGCATASNIMGPYTSSDEPLISPDPDDPWGNKGCGSIKVVPCTSGYVAFQNRTYVNQATGHSGSAIVMLESDDGFSWTKVSSKPILAPTAGWMRTHIYASDTVFRPESNEVYFYFNARNAPHWTKGKEHIGLMIGRS